MFFCPCPETNIASIVSGQLFVHVSMVYAKNKPWRTNTGSVDNSITQYIQRRVHAFNRTTSLIVE